MAKPNLEFVNSIDLRKLHIIVKQGLSDDVKDTLPLFRKDERQTRSDPHRNKSLSYRVDMVYSYRGEDKTLGTRVAHLNPLKCSHYRLHFGWVASLRQEKQVIKAVGNSYPKTCLLS